MRHPLISACARLCALYCLAAAATAADFEALNRRSWLKVETPNFSLVTDQPEATARQVLQDLEALRHFKTAIEGVQPLKVAKPLPVLAIGDDDTFVQLGFDRMWAGMFSLGLGGYSAVANIRGYGNEETATRRTMLHEYCHFVIRMTDQTRALPLWVDEGMAEYCGTFKYQAGTIEVGSLGEHKGRLYSSLGSSRRSIVIDTRNLFNTAQMPRSSANPDDKYRVNRIYSGSFMAVHYFNTTPARRAALAAYLTLLNQGYRQDRAAELAFKMPYAQLDREILAYVNGGLLVNQWTVNQGQFTFPKPEPVVTKLDQAGLYAALAPIAAGQAFPRNDVMRLLNWNRQLNPDHTEANVLPALFGMVTDQQELNALMQRYPGHPGLLTMRARSYQRRAERLREQGDPAWLATAQQARTLYRAAIAADREYGFAQHGLGSLYALLPDSEPLQEGAAALEQAAIYSRSPETYSQLARLYQRMQQPAQALRALRSAVAFSPAPRRSPDLPRMENMELLASLDAAAKPNADGLAYAGGAVYAGALADGKPAGVGRLTLPSGSYYEGEFVQGLPHGKGTLVSDHGYTWQGAFERGTAGPQGEMAYAPGGDK